MTFQHATKAFTFGFAGFVFRDWLWLMLAMVAAASSAPDWACAC